MELAAEIRLHQVNFTLCPSLWSTFDFSHFDCNNATWHEVKFLNDDASGLHSDMDRLPTNSGGIYIFFVKPPIMPNAVNYLMYVGMTKLSSRGNLRTRCKSYYYEYNSPNDVIRPYIGTLISQWGKYLYIRFIHVDNNDFIEELENKLIAALKPPFNHDIDIKRIGREISAYNF